MTHLIQAWGDTGQPLEKLDSVPRDESWLRMLPGTVISATGHGSSYWSQSGKIDVALADGGQESYFIKLSQTEIGKIMAEGEFESTKALHQVSPDLISQPIGWGTYESNENIHFFLCKFADLHDELPDIVDYCKAVADLHIKSQEFSPSGKFGFHVTTCNGTHQQNTEWSPSWEEFFVRCLKRDLKVEANIHGPSEAISEMLPTLLEKVCPRLLRPLETEGRVLKPSLIHGDLWDGNAAVDAKTGLPHLFDPSSIWAHNEYDQNNWRGARFTIGKSFRKEYLNHFPVSPPEEDWDDRNLLYSLRVDVLDSILYNQTQKFRELFIESMRQLVAKFPNGYEGPAARKGSEPVVESQALEVGLNSLTVTDDHPQHDGLAGQAAVGDHLQADGLASQAVAKDCSKHDGLSNSPAADNVGEIQTETQNISSGVPQDDTEPVKIDVQNDIDKIQGPAAADVP